MNKFDTFICIFLLLKIIFVSCDLQDRLNLQHRQTHLPQKKFGEKDYAEYPEVEEENDEEPNPNQHPVYLQNAGLVSTVPVHNSVNFSSAFDSSVKWDQSWLQDLKLGQLSAVDVDPDGNIAIFCRRFRKWDGTSFGPDNKFDKTKLAIYENVIMLFSKSGKLISEWGKNIFYMPHGLTIDTYGNYWLTDVALHQVFKFDKDDIDMYLEKMKTKRKNHSNEIKLKASIELGVPFEPGNDVTNFCKPTAVAVDKNDDFFVSDGYCNSRIIKYNKKGERILQFGISLKPGFHTKIPVYTFYVPHALAIATELGYLFVADRENGRVLSYHTRNGTFNQLYEYPNIKSKIFSIAYANEQLFIVNGRNPLDNYHVHGFIIDINNGNILSQFGPGQDMLAPHDIAVNQDGTEIYVVELNIQKAYRFIQDKKITMSVSNKTGDKSNNAKSDTLDDDTMKNVKSTKKVLFFVAGTVVLVGFCVAAAAVMSKCRKRGCLLVRRKAYWENEKKDNFKLSSLLEPRQGKGLRIFGNRPNKRDFSKLNTEPESSEDDLVDDSITI